MKNIHIKIILPSIFVVMFLMQFNAYSARDSREFDHFETNFPLTGQHIEVPCSDCHLSGVFKGTPTECFICHNNVRAIGKPNNHVPSDNNCDNCHTTFSMSDARFEHFNITTPCSSCHNGSTATGKDPGHIVTTQECDSCHITTSWLNVRFDHSLVTGSCSSCHNGSKATGKPANHILTTHECDGCHNTVSWLGVRFDHNLVSGSCSSCHNGTAAEGKSASHITTSLECNSCHNTSSWSNATVDHALITGSCVSCHNNVTATGKPSTHAITSDTCEMCHNTINWTQSIFVHSSIADHNSSVACDDCHIANNYVVAPWQFPGYAPDCAACHADNYKTDAHKKTESPTTVFYSVSELRDCSGSCHLYEDNTFTTIKKTRSGEHRINENEF